MFRHENAGLMKWNDEDLPALHELESTVVAFWARQPDMTDYAASRVFEAAFQLYRSRLRKHEPKPVSLAGIDADVFNAVQDVCEKLLVTGAEPLKETPGIKLGPVLLEKLVDYLRELQRSVERHTKLGGRQGYLNFVRDYLR